METQKKLYVAGGVLAVLLGALALQNQKKGEEQQAHSLSARMESLPSLELSDEKVKSIDRVVLVKPGAEGSQITLKKTGEESWQLTEPLEAKASATNVQSLLDNLEKLKLSEAISTGSSDYERWGVSDDQALHATFYAGEDTVFDIYLGESGSRGQMSRIAGTDGVYTVKGLSKWLYERDAKGFRDKTVLKFDDQQAVAVTLDNASGQYRFEKDGDSWKGTLAKKDKRGSLGKPGPIDGFAAAKVGDLLRAYKSLNAIDFGDGKAPGDVGLDRPTATLTIELSGGSERFVLHVGDQAEGTNRWVTADGSAQIYSISSWAADWALAEPSKFKSAS